jgi:hypothetical protein
MIGKSLKMIKTIFWVLLLIYLPSCGKSYITVRQEWVDRRYLASSHVNTPDPRQNNPPLGQKLIVSWLIPNSVMEEHPNLVLRVIFWNYTEKNIVFPIRHRAGYKVFSVLNEEYEKTGGLLTYSAQIVSQDNQVYKEWKHQLWVNLIDINGEHKVPEEKNLNPEEKVNDELDQGTEGDDFDEDEYEYPPSYDEREHTEEDNSESAADINSSVIDQSMQGSVIETAYFSEEGSLENN